MIYPKIFKLETGKDLLISLQEMAMKENKAGYILSVVGNLSEARIQCPGKKQGKCFIQRYLNLKLEGIFLFPFKRWLKKKIKQDIF